MPQFHNSFLPCAAALLWAFTFAAAHPRSAGWQRAAPLSGAVPLADEADRIGGEMVLLQHRAGAVRVKPDPPSEADAAASSGSPSATAEILTFAEFGSANDSSPDVAARANEAADEQPARRTLEEKVFPALPEIWPSFSGRVLPVNLGIGPGWAVIILPAAVLTIFILAGLLALVSSPRAFGGSRRRSTSGLLRGTLPIVGLVISFCCYGIAQEYLMTTEFEGRPFPSTPFLVFASRLATVAASLTALILRGEHIFPPASKWAAFPALTAVIGSCCQHEALRFVAFPAQAMLKSAKVIPTVAVGSLFGRGRKGRDKKHGWIDLVLAVVVLTCVSGFFLQSSGERELVVGVSLLAAYLCCDALTSNSERKIYDSYEGLSGRQLMFSVGCFSVVYSAVVVECTVGFHSMLEFLDTHPWAAAHVAALSASSAAGQLLLFSCIRRLGPATIATVMSIRHALSMTLSARLFGHTIHQSQVACASLCFLVVLVAPLLRKISMRATAEHPPISGWLTTPKSQQFVWFS